ncbi:MAG: flagellar type III secretion system pore protein FliP [Sandaracinaceae bacterium]
MNTPRHTVRAARLSFALALGVTAAVLSPALLAPTVALAQADDTAGAVAVTPPGSVTVTLPDLEQPDQMVPAIKILLLMTVLSLAPAVLISMTSFTRIVIVLSFVRQAVGTQNVPPMQVILSLSLLLTAVVMAPIAHRVQVEALDPYEAEQIDGDEAWEIGSDIMRGFLIRQTREDDLLLFYELSQTDRPADLSDVSLHLLVPAFMISELRTGFEMGFLLFLPFVLVDLITGSVLTSMGMVMLPPTMVSTPLKILLFVLVDGWALLTRSLVASFA